MFPTEKLEFEDFYLLEAFQIAYLAGWVPEKEFAVALWANPSIEDFLKRECPSISYFIDKIKKENRQAKDDNELANCFKKVIKTCSDILIYNKCPDVKVNQLWEHGLNVDVQEKGYEIPNSNLKNDNFI